MADGGQTRKPRDTGREVTLLIELDKAAASEYADLSQSFYSLVDAVEKVSADGSVAKAKMAEAKLYIADKDMRFAGVVNDLTRAIIASKKLGPARKQALLDDVFRILEGLKKKDGA